MATSRSPKRALFERSRPDHPVTALKARILLAVAELRVCTGPQLAAYFGMSDKAVRGHLADLYHHGLAERTGVPRSILADLHEANDPSLLHGSAPTVYTLTREGARFLVQAGLADPEGISDIPKYGPKNGYFLAHELQVRDVRVWLEALKRSYPHHGGTALWKAGMDAHIPLERGEARPDAVFSYRLAKGALTGLVEVDRATERGEGKWQDKLRRYALLLPDRARLLASTGATSARVLVTAPTPERRDRLWDLGTRFLPPALWDRFWVCVLSDLRTDLTAPVWRMASQEELIQLVPSENL